MNSRFAFFLLGATLALGIAYSANVVSKAMIKIKNDSCISVKGYAERNITSDRGFWKCTVNARGDTLQNAYALIDKNIEKINRYLKDHGFNENEMTPAQTVTSTIFKRDEKGNLLNIIEGYSLSCAIEVRSMNVRLIDKTSKSITELIREGVEIESSEPVYTVSTIDEIKSLLIADATKNGFERAKILAQNSGGKVGSIKSATQGVFQITTPNSTEVTGYGSYDTTTIEKAIKAVVTLDFHVEK